MKAHLGSDKNGAETAEAAGYIQIFKGARQKLQDGLPRSLRSLAMTFKTSPQALSRLRHCRHMPHDRRCALPPTSLPAHATRPPMRTPAYVIAGACPATADARSRLRHCRRMPCDRRCALPPTSLRAERSNPGVPRKECSAAPRRILLNMPLNEQRRLSL